KMAELLPIVKIANYGFKNTGELLFSNQTEQWGLTQTSFSNGAAYADLDDDGDLDLIVNNINDKAFVYENTLVQTPQTNILNIILKGNQQNLGGIGVSIYIFYGSQQQL